MLFNEAIREFDRSELEETYRLQKRAGNNRHFILFILCKFQLLEAIAVDKDDDTEQVLLKCLDTIMNYKDV